MSENKTRNKVRGMLLDVTRTGKSEYVTFEDTLENIYKLLDVEYIDVICLKVGDKVYDFVVDDEGLLKGNQIPSVFDRERQPMLVGNVLIVNSNEEGEFTSLTEEDIDHIEKHLGKITFYDEEREETRSALVIKDAEWC